MSSFLRRSRALRINGNSGAVYVRGYTDNNNKDGNAHESRSNLTWANVSFSGATAIPTAEFANVYVHPSQYSTVPSLTGTQVADPIAASAALPHTSDDATFLSGCTNSKAAFPDYAVDLFVSIPPYTGAESNMSSAPNAGDIISVSAGSTYTLNAVVTPTNTLWDSAHSIYIQNAQPAASAIAFWDPNGSGTNLGSPTSYLTNSNQTIYTWTLTAGTGTGNVDVGTHPYQVQVTNSDGTVTSSNVVHVTVTD